MEIIFMGKRGRKPELLEKMESTFPVGTFQRIESVIEKGQKRTDYVRRAVIAALEYDECCAKIATQKRKAG